ncbi:hypothetical protein Plhal304r1_c082g0167041 [Plasmopara halstedii]
MSPICMIKSRIGRTFIFRDWLNVEGSIKLTQCTETHNWNIQRNECSGAMRSGGNVDIVTFAFISLHCRI